MTADLEDDDGDPDALQSRVVRLVCDVLPATVLENVHVASVCM